MKKVLFLDVDGVICKDTTLNPLYRKLDRKCLLALSTLQKVSQCDIVISSTWRNNFQVYSRLLKILEDHEIEVLDMTPNLGNVPRSEEIKVWLDKFGKQYTAGACVVLDDEDIDIEIKVGKFFKTDPEVGLDVEICGNIIFYFSVLEQMEVYKHGQELDLGSKDTI